MRVGLEVDVVNLAILAEVLLDVQVLGLLGQASDKQLAIILAEMTSFSSANQARLVT